MHDFLVQCFVKEGEEVVVIGMRGLDGLRALRCDVS